MLGGGRGPGNKRAFYACAVQRSVRGPSGMDLRLLEYGVDAAEPENVRLNGMARL